MDDLQFLEVPEHYKELFRCAGVVVRASSATCT